MSEILHHQSIQCKNADGMSLECVECVELYRYVLGAPETENQEQKKNMQSETLENIGYRGVHTAVTASKHYSSLFMDQKIGMSWQLGFDTSRLLI
jgi:hypothetical protein